MLTNTKTGLAPPPASWCSRRTSARRGGRRRCTAARRCPAADYRGAYAVQQFEPGFINFEFHDKTPDWATYAYSISLLRRCFRVLALGVLIALARRPQLAPFRVLCLAVDRRLPGEPAVVPAVPGAGALGVSGIERDPAVGQLELVAHQLDPADQRAQQLVPEHARVADRDHHRGVLAVPRPAAHAR